MFLALGLILPFFTGQIPQIGNMLLPMHIPVLICGLICGWQYGLTIGLILPLLRHFLIGMPALFPTGIAMTFELAAYGFVIGWMYGHSRWKCMIALYRSLLTAMLAGRIVWGAVNVILMGFGGYSFGWKMFLTGGFITAIPGILLQLILIPAIMVALNKTGLVPFSSAEEHKAVTNV